MVENDLYVLYFDVGKTPGSMPIFVRVHWQNITTPCEEHFLISVGASAE